MLLSLDASGAAAAEDGGAVEEDKCSIHIWSVAVVVNAVIFVVVVVVALPLILLFFSFLVRRSAQPRTQSKHFCSGGGSFRANPPVRLYLRT